ncbi:hypothetical protein THAOC_22680, partial [Thalassiosira oceanica]
MAAQPRSFSFDAHGWFSTPATQYLLDRQQFICRGHHGEARGAEAGRGDLTFDKTTPWTSAANNRPGSRREQVERHNSQTYDAPPLGPPTSAATPGPPVPLLAGGTERLR